MSRLKHTPGPWYLYAQEGVLQISDDDGHSLSSVVVHWQGFDSGSKPLSERFANARLIAAAPTLLEAGLLLIQEFANNPFKLPEPLQKAFEAVEEAVAKAEGRT